MIPDCVWVAVLLLLTPGAPMLGQHERSEPPYQAGDLCAEVVSTLYPQWTSRTTRESLARIEVRNCPVADWGFLQIAAWEEGASRPTLVVDTRRTTIVKVAMAGDVFVLETAGASSNVVQVVQYKSGRPQLVLDDAIKAYAQVDISWKKVVISLPQEKAPPKVYEFPTGMDRTPGARHGDRGAFSSAPSRPIRRRRTTS